jgi:hypothetical protein
MTSRVALMLLLIMGTSGELSGKDSALEVRVDIVNEVWKIASLPSYKTIEQDLYNEVLLALAEYRHWSFARGIQSDYRLELRIVEEGLGHPPALKLYLELYNGDKRIAPRWVIPWREPRYKEGFGRPQELVREIMLHLTEGERAPLTEAAIGEALRGRVPIGFGARVNHRTSVTTSLNSDRFGYLNRSAFQLHCTVGQARLDCNGTGRSLPFAPAPSRTYSALEVKPICIYDDQNGLRSIASMDNGIVVALSPREIYLDHFVDGRKPLYFKATDCK